MSTEVIIRLFIRVGLVFLMCYAIYREHDIARFERKFIRKVKVYARAIIWTAEACQAERKGVNMFVIFKSPGRAPERRHNVANNLHAIKRELDSENLGVVDVGMGLKMFYDADSFAKQGAPCMTDERAERIFYGDVLFSTFNSEGVPRGLTEREVKYIENYISTHRADKRVS